MFFPAELDFIHFVQKLRSESLDLFFKFLNFFDTDLFVVILFPLIWFGINWKTGLKLFYILGISHLINHSLKLFFSHPRPFHLDPGVAVVKVAGYGFPSGAAQNAVLLSGLLLFFWKSRWKWPVALLYFSLISLSRLYLGVHFPSDIMGGWLTGFVFLTLVLLTLRPIEKKLEKMDLLTLFTISQLIPILIFTIWRSELPICASAMGIGAGLALSQAKDCFLPAAVNIKERILRIMIGVSGTLLFHLLGMFLLPGNSSVTLFIRFFFVGLWLSLFGHICCKLAARILWKKAESRNG